MSPRLSRLPGRFGRSRPQAPAGLGPGERVIASARVEGGGSLYVTTHRLVVDGPDPLRRPWHLVDGGGWRPDDDTLWASFVDDRTRAEWVLRDPGTVTEAFRERVQTTVLLTEHVTADRVNAARVVLRREIATGDLSVQTIYREGADPAHPTLEREVGEALERLAEQVGRAR